MDVQTMKVGSTSVVSEDPSLCHQQKRSTSCISSVYPDVVEARCWKKKKSNKKMKKQYERYNHLVLVSAVMAHAQSSKA